MPHKARPSDRLLLLLEFVDENAASLDTISNSVTVSYAQYPASQQTAQVTIDVSTCGVIFQVDDTGGITYDLVYAQ